MIFTRSAGAITVLATAPATPPAKSDSSAELFAAPVGIARRSMYVTGEAGGRVSFALASSLSSCRASRPKSARLVAGAALCSASLAVNPTAAATGPLIQVRPTPLKSPLRTPSVS